MSDFQYVAFFVRKRIENVLFNVRWDKNQKSRAKLVGDFAATYND